MSETPTARAALLQLLRAEGRTDERVLAALAQVPRDEFVPEALRTRAYDNEALPLAQGQAISQPSVVAMMTEALALHGYERVLEIGTGSGYQTAVLSLLAESVVSVERHPALLAEAESRLRRLGFTNVAFHLADVVLGWPLAAPYDAIICTAAAPSVPRSLLAQLAGHSEACLVIPVGSRDAQQLLIVQRSGVSVTERSLGPVQFVPLVGPEAWAE